MISSAYVMSVTSGGGVVMSEVYILKRVSDRTPPCGTPAFVCLMVDVAFSYLVYWFRPLM